MSIFSSHPNVHIIGIGGAGMSGVALLLKEMGCKISGSDATDSPVLGELKSAGIDVHVGHDASILEKSAVVIWSPAVKQDNVEFAAAKQQGNIMLSRIELLRELGASVVAISGHDHDRLVALASHVPHLLAGALMNEATKTAEQDPVLLQLAAGGFRDMTRVAAGDPAIWPDILFENREAITSTLDAIEKRIGALRTALDSNDREDIKKTLTTASQARRQLPGRALSSENLAYLRIAIPDQPGVLAEVTKAASDLLVNIYDIEIAHGIEGTGGTLLLAIDSAQRDLFCESLITHGFKVASE